MAFRKPFQAVPIKVGLVYREQRERRERRGLVVRGIRWSAIAIAIGTIIGFLTSTAEDGRARGLALLSDGGWKSPVDGIAEAVSVYFAYCDQAHAAGRAPLYRGEPGYRAGLDADSDGAACEPYPSLPALQMAILAARAAVRESQPGRLYLSVVHAARPAPKQSPRSRQ